MRRTAALLFLSALALGGRLGWRMGWRRASSAAAARRSGAILHHANEAIISVDA
jgi:hypothetical protein